MMVVLFWTFLAILLYTYVGYGLLIWGLVKLKSFPASPQQSPHPAQEQELPAVTHLIAAYNEEDFIEEKIKNSLGLDYPAHKMTVLVVTDGSDDKTPELVTRYPQVKLMHKPARKGKIAAVKRAMEKVDTSLVIFSDANTYLNKAAVRNMVAHFADDRVGAVAGEKRIFIPADSTASVAGEGLYWKYESFLKKMDARFHSVVGAAGELFAIRKELMPQIPHDTIIEDFYLTMSIAMKGKKVAYDPEAYAMETGSASVEEEMKRKVRISAGAFQAMGRLRAVFNPFAYGWLTFQFVSHRVLRWTLAPLALIGVLLTNMVLAFAQGGIYGGLWAGQLLFYTLAFIGYRQRNKAQQTTAFYVPFYFTMMHLMAFKGFFRHLKGKQSVVWERAQRKVDNQLIGDQS